MTTAPPAANATRANEPPPPGTARRIGALYLAMLPLGFFSFVYVPSVTLVRGDATATVAKLLANEQLFRYGVLSHLVSQVVVVFLVCAFYRLLKPVDPHTALPMLALGLLGVPISFLNEVHNLTALGLLEGADAAASVSAQIEAQVMLHLDMGRKGILVAQVLWGLWMLPMALAVSRCSFLPRLLAIPIAIGGGGYLFDSVAQLLGPGSATISQFTVIAELVLPLWLLVRGVKSSQTSSG